MRRICIQMYALLALSLFISGIAYAAPTSHDMTIDTSIMKNEIIEYWTIRLAKWANRYLGQSDTYELLNLYDVSAYTLVVYETGINNFQIANSVSVKLNMSYVNLFSYNSLVTSISNGYPCVVFTTENSWHSYGKHALVAYMCDSDPNSSIYDTSYCRVGWNPQGGGDSVWLLNSWIVGVAYKP